MYDFAYHRPGTLDEVFQLLEGADTKLLAGGMSLLPAMKLRLVRHRTLVDLGKIADLQGIRLENKMLIVGAMTRHATVAVSEEVWRVIPALSTLAGGIGDPLVRNRGTIGGSLANADPAADYPASILGLGATIVTDRREIAGDDFFVGLFETALQSNEIIREILLSGSTTGRLRQIS